MMTQKYILFLACIGKSEWFIKSNCDDQFGFLSAVLIRIEIVSMANLINMMVSRICCWLNHVHRFIYFSWRENLWANYLILCCKSYCVVINHRSIFIFDQQLRAFIGIVTDTAHLRTFAAIRWVWIAWTVGIGTTATTTWARATITFAVFTAWRIIVICGCIRSNRFVIVRVWGFVMMWSAMMIMMSTISASDIGHLTSQFCKMIKSQSYLILCYK